MIHQQKVKLIGQFGKLFNSEKIPSIPPLLFHGAFVTDF